MKLRHFIFPVMALMGLMSPASAGFGPTHDVRAITATEQHFAQLHQLFASGRHHSPEPPPWLRPNQRQRRLARRRAHAAGTRHAFA